MAKSMGTLTYKEKELIIIFVENESMDWTSLVEKYLTLQ